jgi:hypothetical protein
MFIAAAAPFGAEDGTNELLDQAVAIADPTAAEKQNTHEPKQQQAPVSPTEPQEGTFERFMGSFGNARRWAGH